MNWFNGLSFVKKLLLITLLLIGLFLLTKLALVSKVNLNTIKLIN